MKYCVGVDIGGTSVKLGVMRADGALLKKWEIPTRKGENGAWMFEDIGTAVCGKLGELGISEKEIEGVGVGIPGPVLPNGYVDVCVNLGMQKSYPAEALAKHLWEGVRVKVANDANVAALGELWQGAGKGHRSLCMVTLGTGVGGGLVYDGKIIAGVHGAGGEIGHMHVMDGEPETCNCGGHGCLEQYASATGIVRVAKRKLAETEEASAMRAFGERLSAKDVCDCAKAGDALALSAIRFSMEKLGMVLGHVAHTIDPKIFVIGGGVSRAGEFLTDMIEKTLCEQSPIIRETEKRVVLAKLGNDAGIYGAAKMVLD